MKKEEFKMKNSTNARLYREFKSNPERRDPAGRFGRFGIRAVKAALLLNFALCILHSAIAYPPAPFHTLYGLVRDQYGTPIVSADVHVVLVASNGVAIDATVIPGIAPGVNYQLKVTMDAGLTPIAYKPTAFPVTAPFKLYVVIGGITNLPMQMTGNFSKLGQPSLSTRLDLTLGVDANGDAIPDAWEYAVLGAVGSNLTLNDLNGNSILTGDGRTIMQEYLAGGNPLDGGGSLTITLVDIQAGAPILQFFTTIGNSYTVQRSTNLLQWTTLPFSIPPSGATNNFYTAISEQVVQVKGILPAPPPKVLFFRLLKQ